MMISVNCLWKIFVLYCVVGGPLSFMGCGGETGREVDTVWKEKILEQRREKDREFKTAEDSPMAASQRLNVTLGSTAFVGEGEDGITVENEQSEGTRFSLQKREGGWNWRGLAPGVTCEIGGEKVMEHVVLEGSAKVRFGRFFVAAYPGEDRVTLIVFDPRRADVQNFQHLLYFDPDPDYAPSAVLTVLKKPEPVTMLTSQSLQKTYYKWGKLKFQIKGEPFELTALKFSLSSGPEGRILFIPFNDATNGGETYGAGRYLEIPEPENPHFILDFNLCYNPLCNYSSAYNCPIPPAENRLTAAIRAGEKTYPH